jgi:uncharacterized membrane protein (DUF4010 family)
LPTFIALCLGALVGLERQVTQEESRGEKDLPGVRTFAFTALVGALAVLLARELGTAFAVALFAASATFLVLRYHYDSARRGDPGYTTEIASLCTFAVGALAQAGHSLVAVMITIAMVALLRSKRVLHRAGELLSPQDMQIGIRFLVISGIVLPLLPDVAWDPFGVLRPRDVWRVVVLISGISFVGYALWRLRAGGGSYLAAGLLGGLVSSTATALAYARVAHGAAVARPVEALVVLASGAACLRVGVLVGVVAPALLPGAMPALGAMFAAACAIAWLRHYGDGAEGERPERANPLTLRTALSFAALYASVLLAAAAAREHVSTAATYAVAATAGLFGADAPSLSVARLASEGKLPVAGAAQGIALVAIATTLGKAVIVAWVGRGPFARRVAPSLCVVALVGAAALALPSLRPTAAPPAEAKPAPGLASSGEPEPATAALRGSAP